MRRHRLPTAQEVVLQKWWDCWPEWRFADIFLERAQRPIAVAWFSLLLEWEELLNHCHEPMIQVAKLRWWQNELAQWVVHRSSHPLAGVLAPIDAPWRQLAQGLDELFVLETVPRSLTKACQAMARLLDAMIAVEKRLFHASGASTREVMLLHWLDARRRAGDGGIPGEMTMREWCHELLQSWPKTIEGGRPRRLLARLARLRMESAIQVNTSTRALKTPVRLVWFCWRVATQGP